MRFILVLICALCAVTERVQAAELCGALKAYGQYGPFDYRTHKQELLGVEANHFDANVENLVRGKSSTISGDLDYTLRAFPNHHRALMTVVRYGEKLKTPQPYGAGYSIDCYFDRAVRFRPDDSVVRMLYANYLAKNGKPQHALDQMHAAEKLVTENANLHYNMGLVYMNLKDYDKALHHAHRAYAMGWQLPGLRNMLQRAGKWQEPQKEESAAVAAPAAPAAAPEAAPVTTAEPESKPIAPN